jgi:hypothetical protein
VIELRVFTFHSCVEEATEEPASQRQLTVAALASSEADCAPPVAEPALSTAMIISSQQHSDTLEAAHAASPADETTR